MQSSALRSAGSSHSEARAWSASAAAAGLPLVASSRRAVRRAGRGSAFPPRRASLESARAGPWLRKWWCRISSSLALLGILSVPWLRRGAVTVAIFTLVAAGLTLLHPHHQGRFLHSWVGGVWILAGMGGAMLLRAIPHRRLRAFAATAGISALVFLHAPEWVKPGQTPLRTRSDISWLDLPDYYLPHLATMEHAAFLSNRPIDRFAADSAFYSPGHEKYAQYPALLDEQSAFIPWKEQFFPKHGTTVRIWRRDRESIPGSKQR